MKRTNLPWRDAAAYEVCGIVEIQFAGQVARYRVADWQTVRRVWEEFADVRDIDIPRNAVCTIDAEGFQESR